MFTNLLPSGCSGRTTFSLVGFLIVAVLSCSTGVADDDRSNPAVEQSGGASTETSSDIDTAAGKSEKPTSSWLPGFGQPMLIAAVVVLAVIMVCCVLLFYPKRGNGGGSRVKDENTDFGSENALKKYIDLFFGPMVEDGMLLDDEFTALRAAYLALGVDGQVDLIEQKGPEHQETEQRVKKAMHAKVDEYFGTAAERSLPTFEDRKATAANLLEAWEGMTKPPGIHRVTMCELEVLGKWIEGRLKDWDTTAAAKRFHDQGTPLSHERDCGTNSSPEAQKVLNNWFSNAGRYLRDKADKYPRDEIESVDRADNIAEPEKMDFPEGPDKELNTSALNEMRISCENDSPSSEFSAAKRSDDKKVKRELLLSAVTPPEARTTEVIPPDPPVLLPIDIAGDLRKLLGDDVPRYVRERRQELRDQAGPIIAEIDDLFGDFTSPTESPLALSKFRSLGNGHIAVVKEDSDVGPTPFWFLGDIHGDLLGLDASIQYIDRTSPGSTIVFLGDLFDDEGYGLEVVLRVFQLITERPHRIGYIVGNHDASLNCTDGEHPVFSSSVSPCDFAEFLNSFRDDPSINLVGKRAVEFFKAAPRAIFLPDGLIATHGGVPLTSRLPDLNTPADLECPECLQDFVWTRAHERARKKIPNPTSKSSEFGYEDFTTFCQHALNALGIRAERMIRGHDHFEAGHSKYDRWKLNQCVTVNTMSRRLPRDPFGPFYRTPCIARWTPGVPLEIHQLMIPAEIVKEFYGDIQGAEA